VGGKVNVTAPTLRTSRLLLRPWIAEDADRLIAILQEPDILRYFPRTDPWPREKADRYIAHHLSHWQEHGYGHWAVVTPADGQVVGWNGLEFLPEAKETEMAYLLSREVWGRGYATEAARAALHFGFTNCGPDKIIGLTHPENIASQRVLEKCGMALVDQPVYFGIELRRYWVEREEFFSSKSCTHKGRKADPSTSSPVPACPGGQACPVACGGIVEQPDGGTSHKSEYEALAAFGPLLMNSDLATVMRCNHVCNMAGLDSISTGVAVSFALECTEKGWLPPELAAELPLEWGSGEVIVELTQRIAARRPGLGDCLADGLQRVAKRLGLEVQQAARRRRVSSTEVGVWNPPW